MLYSYDQLPRPTIFAHRGSSAYAPENTLASFKLAVKHDADAIELDVKLTSDHQIVVFHDPSTDRTTGHAGWIRTMTLAELKKLEAGSHFDSSFQDEKIPTLQEVIELVGDKLFFNIELTNYTSPFDDLPERVAEVVKFYQIQDSILFSSFNPLALWRVHKKLKDVPLALLADQGGDGRLARSRLGEWLDYRALHPHYEDVTEKLVSYQHRLRRRVNVYTVNQSEVMNRLFSLGVDGIFTDDPICARHEREKFTNPISSPAPA